MSKKEYQGAAGRAKKRQGVEGVGVGWREDGRWLGPLGGGRTEEEQMICIKSSGHTYSSNRGHS